MTLDASAFRSVLGRFASGVTILTARDDEGQDHGMTVSAFCSLSLDPPLVLACIDHHASMCAALATAAHFGVSVLAEGQEAIARRFAGPEPDRFDGLGFSRGMDGVALLEDALAHIECRLVDRHPAGDHTIFIGEVEAGSARSGQPLLYYRGGYATLER